MVFVLPKYATPELVGTVWLSEFFPSSMVATNLPEDNSTWAASGFIQIAQIGGYSDSEVGMQSSVFSIESWAVSRSSNKAPYGQASNLAQAVHHMALRTRPHKVTLPGAFPQANIFTAYTVMLPRRVPDRGSYAHYNMHVQLNWSPVTL